MLGGGLLPCPHGLTQNIGALVLCLSVPGYRPSRAVFMCAETNFRTKMQIPCLEFQPPDLCGHVPCLDIAIHAWSARFHIILEAEIPYGMPGSSFVSGESNNYFEIYVSTVQNSGSVCFVLFCFVFTF